jgi:hypothetical protein
VTPTQCHPPAPGAAAELHRQDSLARIMHHSSLFSRRASARTPSIRPSGSVCVNSLCNALGIDLPRRRLVGAHGPAAQGPDGIRPSAIIGDPGYQRIECCITGEAEDVIDVVLDLIANKLVVPKHAFKITAKERRQITPVPRFDMVKAPL